MLDDADPAAAPVDADEAARLTALEQLDVLDTDPEPVFDDLAWTAARLCDTPIALVTLVDAGRQWFKARCGVDVSETPREVAFCAQAILGCELMEVPDTLEDPRFANNPFVLDAPGIRFYAGMPLLSPDGHRYGTLCVIDTRPRRLDQRQREGLMRLAAQVSLQLQQRQQLLHSLNRERALTHMLETMPDGVVCCDATGVITRFNEVARDWFGIEPETTPLSEWGQNVGCYAPGSDTPMRADELPLIRALRGERIREVEVILKAPHRAPRILSCNAQPLLTYGGEPGGAVVVMHDVTGLKEANALLAQSGERWRATVDSIGDAVLTTDTHGIVTFANRAAARLLGCDLATATGRHVDALFHSPDEGRVRLADLVSLVLSGRLPRVAAVGNEIHREDGSRVLFESSGAVIHGPDGVVSGAVLVLRDVTQTHELAERISWQESRDPLTGVDNRAGFERGLVHALATRESQKGCALLHVDLDQFKIVNDTCGLAAGDALLKDVAQALRAQLRESDLVGRFGSDEFVCLLIDCPFDAAMRIAEQMRQAITQIRLRWQDRTFAITASVGLVAVNPQDAIADLLSSADSACQLAKEKGGNRVHSHNSTSVDVIQRRTELDWVPRLQDALANDRFELYGQEIVPTSRDAPTERHFEVLLRLRGDNGELVPPMTFIPVAERYGLMPAVDRWVVCRALAALKRVDASRAIRLSINLSGGTLGDDAFARYVEDTFNELAGDYSKVCFEITETAVIANVANAEAFINWFRSQGGEFSLDDFGSGMSSFGYLKRLKVDYLKIDGAFVKNLVHDSVDEAMVKAIHGVGRFMGLRTVAEFVDNETTLHRLREIGVDYAQGYGIHMPQPLDELL
ncbi:EAL domain-containing protein [Cognatilysobacter bugurensis]|uniref:EAL domain-containing protein n=1 Tax=Cognatilysobacter bugurensis TaxID=543356 RepID=A0A918W695_9GAMM|nr:EAL domain-containing protein [Lysobacter bugurensis]GHA72907.1 hypothetical protein GCM10007067_06900 [Lysobacter bugurensis]